MSVGFLDRLDGQLAVLSEIFGRSTVAKLVISLAPGTVGDLVEVNAAAAALLGHRRAELIGTSCLPLFAEPERAEVQARLAAGGVVEGERRLVRKDGAPVLVEVHPVVAGPYLVAELIDVTGRHAELRALVDNCPVGLAVAGDDGRWLRVNPAAAALLGEGQDLTGDLAELRPLLDGRVARHQMRRRYLRPDGYGVWTLVTVTRLPGDTGGLLAQIQDMTAEDELRRREAQFRAAFDASPTGLAIADEDGRVVRSNKAYDELLVRGVEPRTSRTVFDGPAGAPLTLLQCQDIAALERAGAMEFEVQRLRSVLAVHRDLTAAADHDAVLRVVAERAVELFEAADGAAVELIDGDELTYATAAGSLAPFEGTRLPVSGSLSGLAATRDVLAGSVDTTVDERVNRTTCAQLGIMSMLVAPLHAKGHPIGCLQISADRPGAFDDLDEQHLALLAVSVASALRRVEDDARNTAALAALAAGEARFRLAFENSPIGVTLVGLTPDDMGCYLYANPAMSAITGYPQDDLCRMTFRDLMHPDDVPSTEQIAAEVVGDGDGQLRIDRRYVHRDGHVVSVSIRGAVVRDEANRPLYLVNQVEDVTAQRAAEAELRRQARLLELIPAAVIVRDPDGTVRWWNAGAEHLYGWPLKAVAGRAAHRLLSTTFPDHTGERAVASALAARGSWDGTLQQRALDGRRVTVLSRQVLHQPEDGSPAQILEINTDVTAARAAELALAESEQRFRAQFTHSAAGQIIYSLDGARPEINPAFAAMLGYTVAELAVVAETSILHPDDLESGSREIAALYAGEADAFTRTGRLRHAGGHWVDVEATISIIRDSDGHPKSMIGVVTDISARRAAEAARDHAAAALAERNTALEEANQLKLDLIGMLGHEIGNPLSSICGYTEVLTDQGENLAPERRDRAVAAIARQAARLDEIVREVLAMVTLDAGAMTAVRCRLGVRDAVRQALTAVDLPDLPVVGADADVLFNSGHLQQILVNLLSNAGKYGGGATEVRVERAGDRVRVRVVDNGPGVPAEFRHRLFGRLARAERDAAKVRGTGLGLYIVRGLAQANHGDIAHEPNPDGGSIFVLDLEEAV